MTAFVPAPVHTRNASRALAVARWIVPLALVAAAVFASARLVHWAMTYQLSFDGAMNLELARSLVDGTGYRRLYAGDASVSHAIQTRAPFILPAAAAFALFGVGPLQAQLANLAYLLAFAIATFLLAQRWCSWRWGLLAATACLATPDIEAVGLNGYGEVPAMVWWLFALLVLYRPREIQPVGIGRTFLAGGLIGIAVLTKTVLLVGLVALAPVFFIEQFQRARAMRPALLAMAALLAGTLLPNLLHELWHAASLGSYAAWNTWVHEELYAVRMQAGTHRGFADTAGIGLKVATHFDVLASALGIPAWAALVWLAAALALIAGAQRWLRTSPARALVWTLIAFVLIYFVWWLGLTPTQKAWYRRIFNGVVALQLLTILLVGLLWTSRTRVGAPARALAAAAAALALSTQVVLSALGLVREAKAVSPPSDVLAQDLQVLHDLPAGAHLYGIGWHAAPGIALYAGLRLDDINRLTPAALAAQSSVYLLLDPSARVREADAYWRARYPAEQIADTYDLRVVRLTTDRVRDPFERTSADADDVRGYADFRGEEYPYVFGIFAREGDGWRWVGPNADVLLRYAGEPAFVLDVFTQDSTQYRWPEPLEIAVWMDDCLLGSLRPAQGERTSWRLPMSHCALQAGQRVRVRLVSNNLLRSADDRQLAFVSRGLGFDATPSPDGLPADDVPVSRPAAQ